MDQTADLAVHRPGLAVDHEQSFVGRRDHVVTEDTGSGYWAVGVTPLRQRLKHSLAHAGDHFHFTCGQIKYKKRTLHRQIAFRCTSYIVLDSRGERGKYEGVVFI